MKKTLIVANWKMHLNTQEASVLLHRLHQQIKTHRNIDIIIAPTMLTLQPLSQEIDRFRFSLAAQNAYFKDDGPYTGEVSFNMLRDLVDYCIVGHSERRIYFNENLEMIRDKVAAAVRNKIIPILCIGETKPERLNGETKQVIHDQLVSALHNLTEQEVAEIVIAYEPIWAISTFEGEIAKPNDIKRIFNYIRFQISELYGENVSQQISILYGGSVVADTVQSYLELEECNGVLVGSASLNYLEFSAIVEHAYHLIHQQNIDN